MLAKIWGKEGLNTDCWGGGSKEGPRGSLLEEKVYQRQGPAVPVLGLCPGETLSHMPKDEAQAFSFLHNSVKLEKT